jgi:multisubunit Na+/H+ antiporter MnhC subunit
MKRNTLFLVTAAGLVGFAPPAFAYLDPSTGSMILSAIVGLFATMALAVKTYWYKLKAFFRRDRADEPADKQDGAPAGSEPTTDN